MTHSVSAKARFTAYRGIYRASGIGAVLRVIARRFAKREDREAKGLLQASRVVAAEGDKRAAAEFILEAFRRSPSEKVLRRLMRTTRKIEDSVFVSQIVDNTKEVIADQKNQAPASFERLQQILITARPLDYYVSLYVSSGFEAVVSAVRSLDDGDGAERIRNLFLRIGRHLVALGHPDADMFFTLEAFRCAASAPLLRKLIKSIGRNSRAEHALNAIVEVERLIDGTCAEFQAQAARESLRSLPASVLRARSFVEPDRGSQFEPVARRLCYVLNSSFPYSSNGYSTRAHCMATGWVQVGYDVIALTRPGFPVDDIRGDIRPTEEEIIDGIRYVRTLEPSRRSRSMLEYLRNSADALEVRLRQFRPEVVVAASNFLVALPALVAARRVGTPFAYEVRGFWEITRSSREERLSETQWHDVQKILDTFVAQQADHVFTLTEPMKEELVARGISRDGIDLLPNSCDPERFWPRERDVRLAAKLKIPDDVTVIGYAGTLMDYEGLDDLVEACGQLRAHGLEFRLLLVGDEHKNKPGMQSHIRGNLKKKAEQLGFASWLLMPGRVPYEVMPAYYSLFDICPFPRKPWPVCELVSPSKPLEALAMEKGVVVSSVRALTEIVEDGRTGLVFEKGNIDALAAQLARLLRNPGERKRLGEAGREWVQRERTWNKVALTAERRLGGVLEKRAKRPSLAIAR